MRDFTFFSSLDLTEEQVKIFEEIVCRVYDMFLDWEITKKDAINIFQRKFKKLIPEQVINLVFNALKIDYLKANKELSEKFKEEKEHAFKIDWLQRYILELGKAEKRGDIETVKSLYSTYKLFRGQYNLPNLDPSEVLETLEKRESNDEIRD